MRSFDSFLVRNCLLGLMRKASGKTTSNLEKELFIDKDYFGGVLGNFG
jgi:hypothetical protein